MTSSFSFSKVELRIRVMRLEKLYKIFLHQLVQQFNVLMVLYSAGYNIINFNNLSIQLINTTFSWQLNYVISV